MHHATVVGITTPHCIGMKLIEVFSALDAIMVGSKNKRFWIKNSIKPWVTVMSQHHHNTAQGFVYLWVDRVHHMFYLGSHKGMPTDNYAHSSSRMPKFRMHSVPQGYHRIILAQGNYQDMLEREHRLIRARYRNPLYHNICMSWPAYLHWDDQARQKCSAASKRAWSDPIIREKRIKAIKHAFSDPAWKKKHSEQSKRRWRNSAYRLNQTENLKRRWNDSLLRQKIIKGLKRAWSDPALRQKASKMQKLRFHDPIQRQKCAERSKLMWRNNAHREKLKEIMKRVCEDPIRNQKIGVTTRARYVQNPALRQLASARQKKRMSDPALKQSIIAKVKAAVQTAAHRLKQKEISTNRWKDPAFRHRVLTARKKYYQQKKLARQAFHTEGVLP